MPGQANQRRPSLSSPRMSEMGIFPNVVIYTTILSGWCTVVGKMEHELRVYHNIVESGISPNLKTLETLRWGYGESKQPWKVENLLYEKEEKGHEP